MSSALASYAQLGRLIRSMDEIEILAGPSLVTLRGGERLERGREAKVGYLFGLGMRHQINDKVSIGGKLLFDHKGMKQSYTVQYLDNNGIEQFGKYQGNQNFNFLTIPVLSRFLIGSKKSFFAEAGGFVSYLLQEKTSFNNPNNGFIYTTTNTHNYKPIDAGLSAGMGFIAPMSGKFRLSMQFLVNAGMVNINNVGPFPSPTDAKTLSLAFSIGMIGFHSFNDDK
jgi:hypothetical protein